MRGKARSFGPTACQPASCLPASCSEPTTTGWAQLLPTSFQIAIALSPAGETWRRGAAGLRNEQQPPLNIYLCLAEISDLRLESNLSAKLHFLPRLKPASASSIIHEQPSQAERAKKQINRGRGRAKQRLQMALYLGLALFSASIWTDLSTLSAPLPTLIMGSHSTISSEL